MTYFRLVKNPIKDVSLMPTAVAHKSIHSYLERWKVPMLTISFFIFYDSFTLTFRVCVSLMLSSSTVRKKWKPKPVNSINLGIGGRNV